MLPHVITFKTGNLFDDLKYDVLLLFSGFTMILYQDGLLDEPECNIVRSEMSLLQYIRII